MSKRANKSKVKYPLFYEVEIETNKINEVTLQNFTRSELVPIYQILNNNKVKYKGKTFLSIDDYQKIQDKSVNNILKYKEDNLIIKEVKKTEKKEKEEFDMYKIHSIYQYEYYNYRKMVL